VAVVRALGAMGAESSAASLGPCAIPIPAFGKPRPGVGKSLAPQPPRRLRPCAAASRTDADVRQPQAPR